MSEIGQSNTSYGYDLYLRRYALEDVQHSEWIEDLLSFAYVEGQLFVVLGNRCHSFPELSYF